MTIRWNAWMMRPGGTMRTRRTAFFAGAAAGGRSVLADGSPQAPKYPIKVVLENNRVRVRDVTFPPRVKDTGLHTHEFPHVGVILTAGALTSTEPGKPTETTKFETGSVGFREANVTHEVANPGKTPMRVIEVELNNAAYRVCFHRPFDAD
jgi:quercetin dioxygenase-like cupin family protein